MDAPERGDCLLNFLTFDCSLVSVELKKLPVLDFGIDILHTCFICCVPYLWTVGIAGSVWNVRIWTSSSFKPQRNVLEWGAFGFRAFSRTCCCCYHWWLSNFSYRSSGTFPHSNLFLFPAMSLLMWLTMGCSLGTHCLLTAHGLLVQFSPRDFVHTHYLFRIGVKPLGLELGVFHWLYGLWQCQSSSSYNNKLSVCMVRGLCTGGHSLYL